jgi:Protein of unknown function with PCYCGC motif
MNRSVVIGLASALILTWAIPMAKSASAPQETGSPDSHSYHDHAPTGPLPPILDPAQFKDDRASFVAYSLARRIPSVLYQVPCYCPCDKEQGHQSLLDCFTSRHGQRCAACRAEVIFCFAKTRKGKRPEDIREGIALGEAWNIALTKYTDKALAHRKNFDHLPTRANLDSK